MTIPTYDEIKARIPKDENGLDFYDHRNKRNPAYADTERDQYIAGIIAGEQERQCSPGQECRDINRSNARHTHRPQ